MSLVSAAIGRSLGVIESFVGSPAAAFQANWYAPNRSFADGSVITSNDIPSSGVLNGTATFNLLTTSTIDIINNKLAMTADTNSNVSKITINTFPVQYLASFMVMNITPAKTQWGFINCGPTGNVVTANTGNIRTRSEGSSSPTVLAPSTIGVTESFAIIGGGFSSTTGFADYSGNGTTCRNGMLTFGKRGSGVWKLIASNAAFSQGVNTGLGNATSAGFTCQDKNGFTLEWLGYKIAPSKTVLEAVYVNNFTLSNGTSVASHTANTGQSHTVRSGAFNISSNTLVPVAQAGIQEHILTFTGAANAHLRARIVYSSTANCVVGLIIRWVDNNNFTRVELNQGTIKLINRSSGTDTVVQSTTSSLTNGNTYTLTIHGDDVVLTGYTPNNEAASLTAGINVSTTTCGLYFLTAASNIGGMLMDNVAMFRVDDPKYDTIISAL